MSINPARYGLITNEYRWRESYSSSNASVYSKARELDIPTNLDMALTATLVSELFAVLGGVRRRFAVELVGTDHFSIDDFANSLPVRYFHAPELQANMLVTMITSCVIDEDACTTSIELWG